MKHTHLCVIALLLVFLLSSCLRTSTTVIVHTDGSAEVMDSVLFPQAFLDFFQSMSMSLDSAGLETGSPDSTSASASTKSMWNDSSFRAQADLMGDGVTFRSSSSIQRDSMTGYAATFDVKNINGLNIDKNAFHAKMDNISDQSAAGKTPMVFTYRDGLLTINNPRLEPESQPTDSIMTTEAASEQMDLAAQMMKDMSIAIRIRIDGTITETNASYVDGSEISMLEFNFGELVDSLKKHPDVFILMKGTPDQKPGQLEEAMNKLGRGARFELQPVVTVRFK